MEQKDYEAIGEIIKKLRESKPFSRNGGHNLCYKLALDELSNKLSNYFVREAVFKASVNLQELDFNREQFLKDCGVEK